MIATADNTPSQAAQARLLAMRGEPLLLADWDRVLMLHYAVEPESLQPHVPFELDTFHGLAYVSLVAFTMRRMHPRMGGQWTSWLLRPIATHEFLNVRTYVKHANEPGIYFLSEWLPNALSVVLGPLVFGLPYRLARMRYDHPQATGQIKGEVIAADGGGALHYHGQTAAEWRTAKQGSLDEFLMERYTAFTIWQGMKRLFRVWHPPWFYTPAQICITENGLMNRLGNWTRHAGYTGASYSAGLRDVWMSRPMFT